MNKEDGRTDTDGGIRNTCRVGSSTWDDRRRKGFTRTAIALPIYLAIADAADFACNARRAPFNRPRSDLDGAISMISIIRLLVVASEEKPPSLPPLSLGWVRRNMKHEVGGREREREKREKSTIG